jgi:agmatine deiminase
MEAYTRIQSILERHSISSEILKSTKDIWCRDYMPIQVNEHKLVQFRYEPSYLRRYKHLRSNPREVCGVNGLIPFFSDINLDGGNVIAWKDKVIISDRVFLENPEYTDKTKLVADLESLLEAEIIIIPAVNKDWTGHADGYVRFLDDLTLIGNDLDFEDTDWVESMNKVLKDHGLSYINIPAFDHKIKGNRRHAIGWYMNYLEIGDLIIFPVFDVHGNKDQEALNLMVSLYPTKTIEPIVLNEIATEGGLIHCVSWNYKSAR